MAITSNMDSIPMSCRDVLMVPLGLKGHLNPMMYVANRLMKRGISITVVIPEDLKALLFESVEEETPLLSLQVVKALSKVEGLENDPLAMRVAIALERASEPFFNSLLTSGAGTGCGFKCIIADQFLGWTQLWADKLHVPRYVAFLSPAAFAMTMLCHSSVSSQMDCSSDADPTISLPSLPLLHLSDFPLTYQSHPEFRARVIHSSGDSFRKSAGMLFNTFYELESEVIDAFQAEVRSTNINTVTRMLSIGPMLPPAFFEDSFLSTARDSKCLDWLNTRPVSSVLYIAFGSIVYLSQSQILELAHGLEAGEVSFLWILRVNTAAGEAVDFSKVLPPGFQERTKDRGLIYSEFAPQLHVLAHPATGGFLTHCGWNSSLESICRAVPMVGWPMMADQKICCRILVDDVKVATEFKRGSDGSVDRKEVERAVRLLMRDPKGEELKQRVLEVQHQARVAMAPGGSSYSNFETLVTEILAKD